MVVKEFKLKHSILTRKASKNKEILRIQVQTAAGVHLAQLDDGVKTKKGP